MSTATQAETVVAAPPAEVFEIIADIERYPEWAEGIVAARVLDEDLGEDELPTSAEFRLRSGPLDETYRVDYTWELADDATGVVSWQLTSGTALTALTGSYTLAAADGATPSTRVVYRLEVGLRIPLPGPLRRQAERTIVRSALDGLARRAAR